MFKQDLLGVDEAFVGVIPVSWATAGTLSTEPIGRAPYRCTVTAARFIPSAAITGDNTNNLSIHVKNKTGGDTIASKEYATSTDAVDLVEETLTLGAAADLILAAGDIVYIEKTKDGNGLAAEGIIIVEFKSTPV